MSKKSNKKRVKESLLQWEKDKILFKHTADLSSKGKLTESAQIDRNYQDRQQSLIEFLSRIDHVKLLLEDRGPDASEKLITQLALLQELSEALVRANVVIENTLLDRYGAIDKQGYKRVNTGTEKMVSTIGHFFHDRDGGLRFGPRGRRHSPKDSTVSGPPNLARQAGVLGSKLRAPRRARPVLSEPETSLPCNWFGCGGR